MAKKRKGKDSDGKLFKDFLLLNYYFFFAFLKKRKKLHCRTSSCSSLCQHTLGPSSLWCHSSLWWNVTGGVEEWHWAVKPWLTLLSETLPPPHFEFNWNLKVIRSDQILRPTLNNPTLGLIPSLIGQTQCWNRQELRSYYSNWIYCIVEQ